MTKNNLIRLSFMNVLLLSLIFVPAAAQNSEEKEQTPITLTIEKAVDYANKNSRSLKVAKIDLEMSERASKYAWNVFC